MKLLSTSAIALAIAASPVLADEYTEIDQLLLSTQTALNAIGTVGAVSGATQTATNVGNIISIDEELQHSVQVSVSDQVAGNLLVSVVGGISASSQEAVNAVNILSVDDANVFYANQTTFFGSQLGGNAALTFGDIDRLDQSAVNVANMIDMQDNDGDVEIITQLAIATPQTALNLVAAGGNVSRVGQSAVNASNLVAMDDLDGFALQVYAGTQVAGNLMITGGSVERVTQEATNVVNSIDLERRVRDEDGGIVQLALAAQTAGNAIYFGNEPFAPDVVRVTQTALNAANVITVGEEMDGNSFQLAVASQTASNEAYYDFGFTGPFPNAGGVDNLTQEATNAANILAAGDLPNDPFGGSEIIQIAGVAQTATNTLITWGAVNNVTQSATNVANSVSSIVD